MTALWWDDDAPPTELLSKSLRSDAALLPETALLLDGSADSAGVAVTPRSA